MTNIDWGELRALQGEASRTLLRQVAGEVAALAQDEGLAPGSQAAQRVATIESLIKERTDMSNQIPRVAGVNPLPFGAQAPGGEAQAPQNAIPVVQPPAPPVPAFGVVVPSRRTLGAPAPRPAPAPAPVASVTAPQLQPAAAEPPLVTNAVPGVVGAAPQAPEPPLVTNPIPTIGASPAPLPYGIATSPSRAATSVAPSPVTEEDAELAALEARMQAIRARRGGEQAQEPPPRPPQPPYYRPAGTVGIETRALTSPTGRRYVHRPSPSVPGVQRYVAPQGQVLPPVVDLRHLCLPVRDVPLCGTSAGYAVAALRETVVAAATGAPVPGHLSPAYLHRRALRESGPHADPGVSVAEELAVLLAHGVCPEAFAPAGSLDQVLLPLDPSADVAAAPWRASSIWSVDLGPQVETNVKSILAQGLPCVVSFLARASFDGHEGHILPLPGDDEPVLGGHAVLLVGYDGDGWLVRNAHGGGWGEGGYAVMPYGYEASWFEAWTAS